MQTALRLLVFLTLSSTFLPAQQMPDNALKLLDRVAKHYEDAESVHLEATLQNSSHNDLFSESSTEMLSAYVAPGGRFRYDGTDHSGSGLIVSDGTTEWRLRRSFAEYAKERAGTYFAQRIMLQGDDRPLFDAKYLLQGLISLATNLQSAHFGAPDTIAIDGHAISCVVVFFTEKDYVRQYGGKQETRVWIDPASLKVIKQESRGSNTYAYGQLVPPIASARQLEFVRSTVYTTADVDFRPRPDTFTFMPPNAAKEVAKLPDPFPGQTEKVTSAAQQGIDAHVGKMLPPILLHDDAGREIALSSFAGHPLLIDVWATWCGPCINELPELNDIRKSTAATDLKMIAIDQDAKPGVAADLLKRRGYAWEDFHFNKSVTSGLPNSGIPLFVLVDASGKIVYYHTGADDSKGMAQAIARLGKEYESVSLDK